MNKPQRNYTNEELSLLSGQIRGSRYMNEVQSELTFQKKNYSDGYIHRVIAGFSYNNDVWDAVKEVLKMRKQKRKENKAEIEQLVNLD